MWLINKFNSGSGRPHQTVYVLSLKCFKSKVTVWLFNRPYLLNSLSFNCLHTVSTFLHIICWQKIVNYLQHKTIISDNVCWWYLNTEGEWRSIWKLLSLDESYAIIGRWDESTCNTAISTQLKSMHFIFHRSEEKLQKQTNIQIIDNM